MQIKIPFVQNLTLARPRITCRRMVVLFGLLVVGSACICTLSIFFNRRQFGVPQMPLPIGTLIFTNHYAIFKLDSGNSTEETFATVFTTTTVSSPLFSPKLHPDHSKILFEWSKKLPEGPADPGVSGYYPQALYLLDVADGQPPGLLWRAHDGYRQDGDLEPYSSAWTADGQVVTLMGGDIFKLDLDTLMMEQIYDCDTGCRSVSPAPVSNRLLFTSLLEEDRRLKGGIISSLEEGGTGQDLFEDAGIDDVTKPSWSPDESQIAFSMKVNDLDWRGIFLLNTDGTNLVRLTQEEDAYYHTPVWSPDGKTLAFVKQEWYGESGVASFIILMDLQTREMETMISAAWDWNDLQWVK